MKSFRFSFGLLLVTLIIAFAVLLSSSGRLDVLQNKAQVVVVSTGQVKGENVVNSPLPTPAELQINSPLPTPVDEIAQTTVEPFSTPIPRQSIAYPDFDVKTDSILDTVTFSNMRALQLPSADHMSYGLTSWAPDSKKFTGFFLTSPDSNAKAGDALAGLYLGDPITAKLYMLIVDGVWSSWSSDGQILYYLAPRREQEAVVNKLSGVPYYDLHMYRITSGDQKLIASDVGTPYVAQSPVAETVDGDLLLFDTQQRPSKLENLSKFLSSDQSATPSDFVPLTALLKEQQFSSAMQEAIYTFFSVAPTGDFAAVIPPGKPFFILDLNTNSVVVQLDDDPQYASNVAWSSDGKRLAYTSQRGVYIYDLSTGTISTLIQRKDVGFALEDIRSGFFKPAWILDGSAVLFSVKSDDWIYDARVKRPGNLSSFIYAATVDGAHWKPVSSLGLESVAPNGNYAIVYDWDPQTQVETKFIVDILP